MANMSAPVFAANVDSSVSASGPLAGMFGAPTIEPLIDSQDASSLAAPADATAPISESPDTVTSDAPVRHGSGATAPQVRPPAGAARSGARGTSELRARSKRSLSPLSPEHPQRRPIGRASDENPLSGVLGIEVDELKSHVMNYGNSHCRLQHSWCAS